MAWEDVVWKDVTKAVYDLLRDLGNRTKSKAGTHPTGRTYTNKTTGKGERNNPLSL